MNFIENESEEKLRGGYYTPEAIARYLARWIGVSGTKSVLEPTCGDGVFLTALAKEKNPSGLLEITAIELLEEEAAKARTRVRNVDDIKARIVNEDFLGWSLQAITQGRTFDAVIGNPPFIRYQYLPEEYQQKAESIFRAFHLPFTKHTNAWVPVVVASLGLLRPGGRLAMVLPAEIIHVMHAQALRTLLGHACARLLVIDPEEIWFEGTLQGAVLLLAEKKVDPKQRGLGVAIQRVSGASFLAEDPRYRFETARFINGKTVEGKWTRALLPTAVRTLFDGVSADKNVKLFSDIADVDVGLVTGANKFFLVPNAVVDEYGLRRWAHPMFGRSEHCPGVIYDQKQHEDNAALGLPTNFLWFKQRRDAELPAELRAYIKLGEAQKLHKRFKCRVRRPWYEVPSVYATEVGMLKRCHDAPRLIHNVLGAYTTDTAYRIRTKRISSTRLVFSFLNSLTALSAELEGRHYGGGVLELVPSEIERLVVPMPDKVRTTLNRLDEMVRSTSMGEVLRTQDSLLLGALGLNGTQRARLHDAWRTLRDRRQRVTVGDVSDDLEREEGRRGIASVNPKGRIEQVAPGY